MTHMLSNDSDAAIAYQWQRAKSETTRRFEQRDEKMASDTSDNVSARDRYDAIVVGSGAGGSTMAWKLAKAGKRVLVLERGDYLPREPENWKSNDVFVDNRYKTTEKWVDGKGRSFHPATHYRVGGNTKVYGAALFRLRERDFAERVMQDGVSPAWPIGYAEFAPYYLAAERLYEVRGKRGSDPTEPGCAAGYDYPAISHDPLVQELSDGLSKSGYNPFPLPLALRLDESQPQTSACVRCGICDGFPCPLGAKSDAEEACLRPALETGNVTLLTGAYVERLQCSASGREIAGVSVRRAGQSEMYRADIVIVACGAINSAALLLRSACTTHPDGVANGSGVVGRHYMCHLNSAVLALVPERNETRFQKTLGLNDFYDTDGHVQMLGKTDGGQIAGDAPVWAPRAAFDVLAGHAIDFWLMSEDLPNRDNRVTLQTDGTICLSYTPNNLSAHRRLRQNFEVAINKARNNNALWRHAFIGRRIPLSGVAHQNGTIRFGLDPSSSALNTDCRAHEVDNLYVVDGSFFASSGAINPTLTIIANALRVGDTICKRLQ